MHIFGSDSLLLVRLHRKIAWVKNKIHPSPALSGGGFRLTRTAEVNAHE